MNFCELPLYARTLRYLKLRQVIGRVLRAARRATHPASRYAGRAAPPYPGCEWHPLAAWISPVPLRPADPLLAGEFTFLGATRSLGFPPKSWTCPDCSRLWTYNLHYLDVLWCLEYADARTLALDWIAKNPAAADNAGWEPYPVSLRIINLCCTFWGRFPTQIENDPALLDTLWTSLYRHVEYLRDHTETHLLGNHYLENGAALAIAGACFDGSDAPRWLEAGLRILREQIPEQFPGDGMHFELSPMYHQRATWLLAAIRNTGNSLLEEIAAKTAYEAAGALSRLCHPDGDIALLNDSAFDIYAAPEDLIRFARPSAAPYPPVTGAFALPDAGYYGWRSEAGHYVVCDCGSIGPDYIPGHAHGDMFSFELSLNGCRVIVDSGTHGYDPGPMRAYCRSTGAHNTVCVNDHSQAEFWAAHRVGRRGRPYDVTWQPSEDGFSLEARHNGYRFLHGRPTHHRQFLWSAGGTLTVIDTVPAETTVDVATRLHLHPECRATIDASGGISVAYAGGRFRVDIEGDGRTTLEHSLYCPQFGERIDSTCIVQRARGTQVRIVFRISPVE